MLIGFIKSNMGYLEFVSGFVALVKVGGLVWSYFVVVFWVFVYSWKEGFYSLVLGYWFLKF